MYIQLFHFIGSANSERFLGYKFQNYTLCFRDLNANLPKRFLKILDVYSGRKFLKSANLEMSNLNLTFS